MKRNQKTFHNKLISFVLVLIFFFFILLFFEFLIFKKLHTSINQNFTKNNIQHLHTTNYYEKNGINKDPYKEFVKLKLHPYYIFGFPVIKKDLNKINNKYVNLNKSGFRKSLNFENRGNVIVTGGSVAFGHFASSDNHTISSYISKLSLYNGVNLGVPSWNSYQELLSLVKYSNNIKYALSISSGNDFEIFCANDFNRINLPDTVEFFPALNEVIHGEKKTNVANKSFIEKIKYYIEVYFPNSVNFYFFLKNSMILKKKDDAKKMIRNIEPIEDKTINNQENIENFTFCGGKKSIDRLIDKFLSNQKIMRELAYFRNADYWLIIQPYYRLHENVEKIENYYALNYYVKKIKESNFCKKNCLDYSSIFDGHTNEILKLKSDMADRDWPQKSFFVDNFHLTDLGTKILVEKLIKDLSLD